MSVVRPVCLRVAVPSSILALLFAPSVAGAACTAGAGTQEVTAAVERAEGAFGNVDIEEFNAATDAMAALLPCVNEVIPRNTAASIHRMQGLRAFVDRDPERATQAFAAARTIEPAYRFPELLVPEGHPVLRDYDAIPIDAPVVVEIPKPAGGYIQVDGRTAYERPTAWPVLVQIVSDEGAVRDTAYLRPSDPLPQYTVEEKVSRPVAAAGTDTVGGGPEPVPVTVGPSVPIAALGGVALITSGVMYLVANGASKAYHDPSTAYTELDGLRSRTNSMQVASVGLAAAGAGIGVTAVVVGQW